MKRKELPIGIEDFKVVASSCYYVDKTEFISNLCRLPEGSTYFFTRPRRFGKSLAISMLECFFNIDEDNRSLFLDKHIAADREAMSDYLGSFPVIRLSMKDFVSKTQKGCMVRIKSLLQSKYEEYLDMFENANLLPSQRQYVDKVISGDIEEDELSRALARLASILHRIYKKKVIILIDEYDTPIRIAYEQGYYDEIIFFFKQLYGEALKGNPDVRLAILTGILQIAKESLFSGLNSLWVDSVMSVSQLEIFGFNEPEVKGVLSYYGLSEKMDEVRQWYDGYRFGDNPIYNPWSILNYIREKGTAKPYWVNTAENSSLQNLLSAFVSSHGEKALLDLMSDQGKVVNVSLAISYSDLSRNPDAFLSYLLSCGYLTAVENITASSCRLKIPNREIYEILNTEILGRYMPISNHDLPKEIKGAISSGDDERLQKLLKDYLFSSFSYFDFGFEKGYQIMLLTLTSLLFEDCLVKSEPIEGLGRADIVAYPKKEGGIGLVIEVKSFRGEATQKTLAKASVDALKQIEERQYDESLKKLHPKSILHFGVSFFQKSVEVSSKRVL